MSRRDLEKMGKKGPDTAPQITYREYQDRDGITRKVPHGIDPGFDYNPGKAADRSYKALADRFESLEYGIAKPWMNEFLQGPVFSRFFDGDIKGDFPVAVLSPEDKKILGSKARTVWLSRTSLMAHKTAHPDIGLPDYRLIPQIIENGEFYKQGAERLIFLHLNGRLYRAALKRTRDKSENYWLTLFTTSDKQARWQVREKYDRVR